LKVRKELVVEMLNTTYVSDSGEDEEGSETEVSVKSY